MQMTMATEISPTLRTWIVNNLEHGCTEQSLLEMMVLAKYDPAYSANCIEHIVNDTLKTPTTAIPSTLSNANYQYEASRIASGNTIALTDRTVKVALRLKHPDVVLIDQFLSDAECEELIEQSRKKLLPSAIVDPTTGDDRLIPERTSEGTYFQRGENALILGLERRISELMNWPVECGEGIQVLHYKAGAEYQPHFDYFPIQDSGSAPHLAKGGQRVATLVMYLNDVTEGGETVFPDVGLSIAPKRGSAAYFAYCNSLGQVDPATLHAGAPVVAGEKWIATKWMRQNKYG